MSMNESYWDRFVIRMRLVTEHEHSIEKHVLEIMRRCSAQQWNNLRKQCSKDGWNPLHIAVIRRWHDIVEVLVSKLSQNRQHHDFAALLGELRENREYDFDVVHSRSSDGLTALHIAVMRGDIELVKKLINVYDAISQARQRHMPWEFSDSQWLTPLHYAVLWSREDEMKELLRWKNYNQHVDAGDRHRRTALHMASGLGTVPIDAFINHPKVDINAVDCCHYTPLHWAVHSGNHKAFRSLLSHPKDVHRTLLASVEDDQGKSILQMIDEGAFSNGLCNDRRAREYVRQVLLSKCPDVQANLERLYKDREVFVQTANAFLVGAALVTGGAINGWLQPPGQGTDNYDQFHVFYVANSCSFFLSIATIMAGAMTALPWNDADAYLGRAVQRIRKMLLITSTLFLISIFCLLSAFGSLGFTDLSIPYQHFRKDTMAITATGAVVCVGVAAYFCKRVCSIGLHHFRTRIGSWHYGIRERIAINWFKVSSFPSPRFRKEIESRSTEWFMFKRKLNDVREIYEEMLKTDVEVDETRKHFIPHWGDIGEKLGNAIFSTKDSKSSNATNQNRWPWADFEERLRELYGEQVYRIQKLEDAYHKLRHDFHNLCQEHEEAKPKVTSAIEYINQRCPGGIHEWIDEFPTNYCRAHVVVRDLKRYNEISQKVQTGIEGNHHDRYTVLTEEIVSILLYPLQKPEVVQDRSKSLSKSLADEEDKALKVVAGSKTGIPEGVIALPVLNCANSPRPNQQSNGSGMERGFPKTTQDAAIPQGDIEDGGDFVSYPSRDGRSLTHVRTNLEDTKLKKVLSSFRRHKAGTFDHVSEEELTGSNGVLHEDQ